MLRDADGGELGAAALAPGWGSFCRIARRRVAFFELTTAGFRSIHQARQPGARSETP
jgi:hypothetical protein